MKFSDFVLGNLYRHESFGDFKCIKLNKWTAEFKGGSLIIDLHSFEKYSLKFWTESPNNKKTKIKTTNWK